MRALVQRVSRAAVTVDSRTVAAIGPGLMILLGHPLERVAHELRFDRTEALRQVANVRGLRPGSLSATVSGEIEMVKLRGVTWRQTSSCF